MPIEIVHGEDPTLVAQAAFVGAGAPIEEEIRRYQEQQAESVRRYEGEQDWRVQAALLQQNMQRQQLNQQASYQAAQLQSQNYGRELAYDQHLQDQQQVTDRAQMQADQQSQAQAELSRRSQMSQLGQIARQQQGQRFQQFMAERESFEKQKAMYTPRQQKQFREKLSEQYGIDYNAPEEVMAASDTDERALRLQQNSALFQDPYDASQSMLSPGEESIVDQLPPIEKLEFANKRRSERIRRYGLEMKEQEVQQRAQLEQEKLKLQQAAGEQKIQNTALKQAEATKKSNYDYDSRVQLAKARANTRYNQLIESAIKSKSDSVAPGTAVSLSDEEKLQLWQRALSENPRPLEMPAS